MLHMEFVKTVFRVSYVYKKQKNLTCTGKVLKGKSIKS
ncbi:hypothetical protein PU02_0781 [Bartonella ancashensis]|uniref:Uncharacterized protein n=1 Tax=Bartonella ancashensis TaxID=1318743 RepID=A0A0M3T2Z6_9HYPH|nr:hypothetical protein PU02_0781 [Bartonella ancashensis]